MASAADASVFEISQNVTIEQPAPKSAAKKHKSQDTHPRPEPTAGAEVEELHKRKPGDNDASSSASAVVERGSIYLKISESMCAWVCEFICLGLLRETQGQPVNDAITSFFNSLFQDESKFWFDNKMRWGRQNP